MRKQNKRSCSGEKYRSDENVRRRSKNANKAAVRSLVCGRMVMMMRGLSKEQRVTCTLHLGNDDEERGGQPLRGVKHKLVLQSVHEGVICFKIEQ